MNQFFLRAVTYPHEVSVRNRALALALLTAMYAAIFISSQGYRFSLGITELIILPAAAAGWFFGIRGGLAAGVLATPFNLALMYLSAAENIPEWLLTRGPIETATIFVIALMAGHVSTLQFRLNRHRKERRMAEKALDEANQVVLQREEMLRRVTDNMLDAIVEIDAEMIISYISPSCQAIIGYSTEEMTGRSIFSFVHPEDMELAKQAIQSALMGEEETIRVTLRAIKSGGQVVWVETAGKVALDPDGRPYRAVFGVRDITPRVLMEQAEREQRALADALRDTAAVLSSTLDQDKVLNSILTNIGRVVAHDGVNIMLVDSNETITRITRGPGYEMHRRGWRETVLGKSLNDIPGLKWMVENKRPLVIQNTHQTPFWGPIPGSEWIQSYIGAPMFAHGELVGFVNLNSDTPNFFDEQLSERVQAFADQAAVAIEHAHLYAALQQQALTDEVTQIYNRRGLLELGQHELDRALRFHRSLSALMFDIDHFKQVNDTYGHPVGDQVLRILAERCRGNIREVDIFGRYGGEEFVILLVENDLKTAANIAGRLCRAVDQFPFDTTVGSIHITISIGVASLNENTADLSGLIWRADQALYGAKAQGRNCIYFSE